MRIWLVNHYALPPGSKGGPSRHLGLSRALCRRGHDVTVIASAYDHYTRAAHRDLGQQDTLVEDIDGVRYVWLATPPYAGVVGRVRNMVTFARTAVRRVPTLPLERPDVVVGSSPHLLAPHAARRLARRFDVPFVMEVRDLWPQSLIDLGEMRPSNPAMVVLRRLESSLYRSADHIIAVPPHAIDHICANGGRPEGTSHIPNGVDLALWPRCARPAGADAPPFTLVYAGTLGHANGLEVVVEAARQLQAVGETGIRIRLVGAGPERDRLQAMLAGGGGSIASVEDPVASSDVPGLLAEADACLMVLRDSPVFRWGISPTKLFEYFAAARPVVFAVRTPTDLVADLDGGVSAEPGDPGSLADAIVRLRDTPSDDRDAMGERLRRYAEERHGFDALAASLEDVLAGVVARARAGQGA
jgi:glycosyltransferase involved in cell wall biosynthesis